MTASVTSIVVVAVLMAWIFVAALACYGCYRAQRPRDLTHFWPKGPRAVVIIPVKGRSSHLEETWRGLSQQSYENFRVIFAVESASDPAYEALRALTGGPPSEVVIAGSTERRSQKIHNMLAALRTLRDDDAMVVFADADIVPGPLWLVRLLKWLENRDRDVVSGYRWMVPTDDRWATAFVCVINSSVATAAKVHPFSMAWGGSMAMNRSALATLELEKYWDRASLDDLTLTRAVWEHGGRVHCPRDALVHSPASYDWRSAIAFARRQYLFIRIHAPWHWALMGVITTVPLVGWAVALPLAFQGSALAIGAIVAANALDVLRSYYRVQVPKSLHIKPMPKRVVMLDRWGTPLWLLVNAVVLWSTLLGRRIDWSGRSYSVDNKGDVRRIEAQVQ